MGLIGIAVATDRFEIALLLSPVTFITLRVGRKIRDNLPDSG
ncbi:MAG: hypothetical protein WBN09_01550 [Woeseiaceae bacterium]